MCFVSSSYWTVIRINANNSRCQRSASRHHLYLLHLHHYPIWHRPTTFHNHAEEQTDPDELHAIRPA